MKRKDWSLVGTFTDADELRTTIAEKCYTVRQKRTVHNKSGVSVYLLCLHERKFACKYQMYFYKPEVGGAPFELYEHGEHVCRSAEYKTGLSRQQRETVDLAMSM